MLYVQHIPKTGISSLMAAFKQAHDGSSVECWWHSWLQEEDEHLLAFPYFFPEEPSFAEAVSRHRTQNPSLRVIGAHVSSLDLAPCLTPRDTVISVFREPFAQAESCFAFLVDVYDMPATPLLWLATMLARPLSTLWDRQVLETKCAKANVQVYRHGQLESLYQAYNLQDTFQLNSRRLRSAAKSLHLASLPVDRTLSRSVFELLNPDELDLYDTETGSSAGTLQTNVRHTSRADRVSMVPPMAFTQLLRQEFGLHGVLPMAAQSGSKQWRDMIVNAIVDSLQPQDVAFTRHQGLHHLLRRYDLIWSKYLVQQQREQRVRLFRAAGWITVSASGLVLLLVVAVLLWRIRRRQAQRLTTVQPDKPATAPT